MTTSGHIAFACASGADVEAVHDRLVGLGATSDMAPTRSPDPTKIIAYLADPDGNLIELVQRSWRASDVPRSAQPSSASGSCPAPRHPCR